MARYSLVRGWIECEYEDVKAIRGAANAFWRSHDRYNIDAGSANLYWKGWYFPESPLNWTSFVFFGANVRSAAVPFIRDSLIEIVNLRLDVEGLFYVDGDEGEGPRIWKIGDQCLLEEDR